MVTARETGPENRSFYFLCTDPYSVPDLLVIVFVGDVRIRGSWIWILLVPWPTFALIMSAEAGGTASLEPIAFLISAAANVAVYGLVGIAFRFAFRRYSSRPLTSRCPLRSLCSLCKMFLFSLKASDNENRLPSIQRRRRARSRHRCLDETTHRRIGAIAHRWFEAMRKCGDEVRELLHDGCPTPAWETPPSPT